MFSVVVPNRTGATLLKIIKERIAPGSIIISDMWKGYTRISQLKQKYFEHETVNHSETFKDPTTGACTNVIEGAWQGLLKSKIHVRNYQKACLGHYLHRRIWMRRHENHLWTSMWGLLSDVDLQVEIDELNNAGGTDTGKRIAQRLAGPRSPKKQKI